MNLPSPYWLANYSAARRSHHHRCVACNRIVKDGEPVFMARVTGGGHKALHEGCAARRFGGFDGVTHLNALEAWGYEYLANCGWAQAKAWVETSPFFKPHR